MDTSLIRGIPTPINVSKVHGYGKAVKGAKLSALYQTAAVSRKAQDLLADCCEHERLPAPVPNFLEINESAESPAFVLLRPVMEANEYTIPVTVAKERVKVDLAKLLEAKQIRTVSGSRLVIPVSSVTINGWGAALLLHLGDLDWVPVKKKGQAAPAPAAGDHKEEKA